MSVSVTVNWITQLIVSATFLSLVSAMGAVWTFVLYAVICVFAIVWIWFQVPETNSKSLEQLADEMAAPNTEPLETVEAPIVDDDDGDDDEHDVELE